MKIAESTVAYITGSTRNLDNIYVALYILDAAAAHVHEDRAACDILDALNLGLEREFKIRAGIGE